MKKKKKKNDDHDNAPHTTLENTNIRGQILHRK